MSISVEALKMSFLRNMITLHSRSATTTEPIGLTIGAYIHSPDPLHYPKISTRNVLNWISNELISSGIQFGEMGLSINFIFIFLFIFLFIYFY
jgi:hypothetical protein